MITSELWKKNVSDSVRSIADRNFQELAWYGNLEGIASSPSEVYCMLFDDDDIEDFIESPQINLSVEQKALGHALINKMNEFFDRVGEPFLPSRVLGDPEWDRVCLAARDFLKSLVGDDVTA